MSKSTGYSKNISNLNANSATVNSLPINVVVDNSGGSLGTSFGAVQSSLNDVITDVAGDAADIAELFTGNNIISGSNLYTGTNTFSASNSFTAAGNTFTSVVNYTSDISNNFTSESLVTKRYCDTALLSSANVFTNSQQFNASVLIPSTGSFSVIGAGTITRTDGAIFQCLSEYFTSPVTVSSNRYRLAHGGGSNGCVFVLATAPTAAMTLDLWNCSASSSQSCVYTLIYLNTNKVAPNTITIYTDNGVTPLPGGFSIIWLNGVPSIPTATVSVFSISIINGALGANNYGLATLVSYY
jgi:hypothetical protein